VADTALLVTLLGFFGASHNRSAPPYYRAVKNNNSGYRAFGKC